MKTCSRCGEEKPLEDYPRRKGVPDGRRGVCNECKNAHKAKMMEEPAYREKMSAYFKRYNDARREAQKSYWPEYYKKHSEEKKRAANEWYHANKERVSLRNAKYRKKNHERILAQKRDSYRRDRDSMIAKAQYQRDTLDDQYVLRYFRERLGVKNPPQELIDLKRVQLQIHRGLQTYEHSSTD